jgi:Na+-transporting methylmalonyl-CoA/oxaloacetate decarboxylase gamma subunit
LSTIAFSLVFLAITCYAIWLLSKESRDAGKEESNASHAKENLETRKRFDEEMDRPLSGGSDLVRKLRDWSKR